MISTRIWIRHAGIGVSILILTGGSPWAAEPPPLAVNAQIQSRPAAPRPAPGLVDPALVRTQYAAPSPQVAPPAAPPVAPPAAPPASPAFVPVMPTVVSLPSPTVLVQPTAPTILVAPTPAPNIYVPAAPAVASPNLFLPTAPALAAAPVMPVAAPTVLPVAPNAMPTVTVAVIPPSRLGRWLGWVGESLSRFKYPRVPVSYMTTLASPVAAAVPAPPNMIAPPAAPTTPPPALPSGQH